MHPASSVILFTVASGAGYGVLIWLGVSAATGSLPAERAMGFLMFFVSLGLITLGLLASTFHLGHPERAWRAVTQWRTSWLSREGVAALLTYLPAVFFGIGWVIFGANGGIWALVGLLSAGLAVLTIVCTGMIYASLKPVPRWNNGWVVPLYLLFALASGSLLLVFVSQIFGHKVSWLAWISVLLSAATWLAKAGYWRFIDAAAARHTAGDATGLGRFGRVRALEAPHTSENYLLKEMGFAVARKHAARLRQLALVCGAVTALAALIAAISPGLAAAVAAAVAVIAMGLGVVIERWLFFAEAQHAVTLFYGAPAV